MPHRGKLFLAIFCYSWRTFRLLLKNFQLLSLHKTWQPWIALPCAFIVLTLPHCARHSATTMTRRTQYAVSLKKQVILLSEGRGNAARHLGLSESTIRGWRKYRDCIFQVAPTREAFCGLKNGHYSTIDKDLAELRMTELDMAERRGQFLPVHAELAQLKARKLAREAGVPCDTEASRWVQKFVSRQTRFAKGIHSAKSFWLSTRKNYWSSNAILSRCIGIATTPLTR